jgi:shikimate kinase
LATGGGAFMNPQTRKCVKELAISIWLRADFDVLLRRVSRRDNRPLLKVENKEEVLRGLIEERYPTYGEADIIVQSQDGPHEETVSEVIAALKQFLENESADGDAAPPRQATP